MKQTSYLLDTNICAFYLRGRYDIDQRIDEVGWENCYISEITMMELKMGVELSMQRDGIFSWFFSVSGVFLFSCLSRKAVFYMAGREGKFTWNL